MLEQVMRLLLFLGLLMLSGCHGARPMPAEYGTFAPGKAQWVLQVDGIQPVQAEKIPALVEEVAGVEKGSVLVSPEGRYVAFKTTVPRGNGKAHGAVLAEVEKKLKDLGLRPGERKTGLW